MESPKCPFSHNNEPEIIKCRRKDDARLDKEAKSFPPAIFYLWQVLRLANICPRVEDLMSLFREKERQSKGEVEDWYENVFHYKISLFGSLELSRLLDSRGLMWDKILSHTYILGIADTNLPGLKELCEVPNFSSFTHEAQAKSEARLKVMWLRSYLRMIVVTHVAVYKSKNPSYQRHVGVIATITNKILNALEIYSGRNEFIINDKSKIRSIIEHEVEEGLRNIYRESNPQNQPPQQVVVGINKREIEFAKSGIFPDVMFLFDIRNRLFIPTATCPYFASLIYEKIHSTEV